MKIMSDILFKILFWVNGMNNGTQCLYPSNPFSAKVVKTVYCHITSHGSVCTQTDLTYICITLYYIKYM